MSVIADYTKLPKALLVELINDSNLSHLTPEQLRFEDFQIPETGLYNTQVNVWWNSTEDMVGMVTIQYDRMDVDYIFSETGIELIAANVDFDSNKELILNDRVFEEIHRRYNVNFFDAQFDLVLEGENHYLKAQSDNEAYYNKKLINVLDRESYQDAAVVEDDISFFIEEQNLSVVDLSDTFMFNGEVIYTSNATVSDDWSYDVEEVLTELVNVESTLWVSGDSTEEDSVNVGSDLSIYGETITQDTATASDDHIVDMEESPNDTVIIADSLVIDSESTNNEIATITDTFNILVRDYPDQSLGGCALGEVALGGLYRDI